ncbi:MAG: bifunctional phosphopantothenoylcysteine decarboxylase/phosphopantothenate--cysteine ligase CoaBC [Pseudomonadota bacterium]
MKKLQGQKILIGITGGIAAYKSVELIRRLRDWGAEIKVVMTANAQEFVSRLTFQAVSGYPVYHELFDEAAEAAMGHIELARWGDIFLIAPATANTLAKIAHGHADDLLSTLVLASPSRLIIAPAMNQQMWSNPAVQRNIQKLTESNVEIIGPGSGAQACGDVGAGRMLEPLAIRDYLANLQAIVSHGVANDNNASFNNDSLFGKHLVITAGPTQEPIDPVRFITNMSSGKMGYALAEVASQCGATVTLISGPVNIQAPLNVTLIKVTSALEMLSAVESLVDSRKIDVFVGCAAVADYRCKEIAEQKIKKSDDELHLSLIKNPDILQEISHRKNNRPQLCVGFAAETENLEHNAHLKLNKKRLDFILANDVSDRTIGFDVDENRLSVFFKNGEAIELRKQTKLQISFEIMKIVAEQLQYASCPTKSRKK